MSPLVDYPLLPTDDDVVDVDEDVASAVASVLQDIPPVAGEAPEAYGMTWDLDFTTSRFRRQGQAPAVLRGVAGLRVWCEMAIRVERYAHSAFSDAAGMERPNDIIGHIDVGERIGDYEQRLREALLVHDRISDIVDFEGDYLPDSGTLVIHGFTIVTDDEQRLPFGRLRVGVGA